MKSNPPCQTRRKKRMLKNNMDSTSAVRFVKFKLPYVETTKSSETWHQKTFCSSNRRYIFKNKVAFSSLCWFTNKVSVSPCIHRELLKTSWIPFIIPGTNTICQATHPPKSGHHGGQSCTEFDTYCWYIRNTANFLGSTRNQLMAIGYL